MRLPVCYWIIQYLCFPFIKWDRYLLTFWNTLFDINELFCKSTSSNSTLYLWHGSHSGKWARLGWPEVPVLLQCLEVPAEYWGNSGLLTVNRSYPLKFCSTHLVSFYCKITLLVDQGKPYHVIFLDIIDTYIDSYSILLDKNIVQWVNSWLMGQDPRIAINGVTSGWQPVTSRLCRASLKGQFSSVFLLMTWTQRLNSHWVNLLVILNWEELLTCLRIQRLCREILTD